LTLPAYYQSKPFSNDGLNYQVRSLWQAVLIEKQTTHEQFRPAGHTTIGTMLPTPAAAPILDLLDR
jgi:hypothetical protein